MVISKRAFAFPLRTMPVPALIDVELDAAEARALFDRLLWNIELMLAQGGVHGDLSAYNVLYWRARSP